MLILNLDGTVLRNLNNIHDNIACVYFVISVEVKRDELGKYGTYSYELP